MWNTYFNTLLKTSGSQEPSNTTNVTVTPNANFIYIMAFVILVAFIAVVVALLNMREKIQDLEKRLNDNNSNITEENQEHD